MLEVAIDGYQRFPGAEKVAAKHLSKNSDDPELAVDTVIEQHIRLAGL